MMVVGTEEPMSRSSIRYAPKAMQNWSVQNHPKSFIFPDQLHLRSLTAEDIRVTSIEDGHCAAAEELTASGSKLNLSKEK